MDTILLHNLSDFGATATIFYFEEVLRYVAVV